jgi:hypothetical protein
MCNAVGSTFILLEDMCWLCFKILGQSEAYFVLVCSLRYLGSGLLRLSVVPIQGAILLGFKKLELRPNLPFPPQPHLHHPTTIASEVVLHRNKQPSAPPNLSQVK